MQSTYLIKGTTLRQIASAIKEKRGSSATIPIADMATEIAGIRTAADKRYEKEILEGTLSGVYCNTTLSSLASRAFYNFSDLTEARFTVCKRIGSSAFENCTSLTAVSFPNCSNISAYAFADCTNLTTVHIPQCSNLGANAFRGCVGLTSVSFPRCYYIANSAFYDCNNLSLAFFSCCSSIYSYAFYNCYNLMNLTLPSSRVASLYNRNAFYNTPLSNSTYTGSFGSIYVPSSLVSSYRTATYWSYYSSRITAIV